VTTSADREAARRAARQLRGTKARKDGRASEWVAAFWLMAHGWRIIGFRLKTPQGEIDLLARRGRVLAVVEVKRRATLEAALEAVNYRQRRRLQAAAESIAAKAPGLSRLSVRLDLLAMAPGRLPRHIADAWAGTD